MANTWLRLYFEFANDPKVQIMSEAMQRRLVMLFCEKGSGESLTEKERCFHWRISDSDLAETREVFLEQGFIDDQWNLLNWDKRQFTSEYNQQERHRQKRASAGLSRRRWINPGVRKQALARDEYACVYCSSTENLTLDHLVPEMKGGSNDLDNLVTACRQCNAKKREFTIEQAGMSYRKGYVPPHASPSKGLAFTDTDTDTDKKPSRVKREPDPRHSVFKELIAKAWAHKNTIQLPWDAATAKQLSLVLGANPDLDAETFKRCLNNRNRSQVNLAEIPRVWIPRILDYANGPLDRFNQPLGAPGPKVVPPAKGDYSALDEIREMKRKALEEKQQQEAERAKQAS